MLPSFPPHILSEHNLTNSQIAGVDEAGRGPLAGPIWAAAVIIPEDNLFAEEEWICDSKKLSEKKRNLLYHKIKAHYITASYHLSATTIDEIGIAAANKQVCVLAAQKLSVAPRLVIVDGNLKFDQHNIISLVKGDNISRAIAAASIIAKYERDQYMQQLSITLADYGFTQHKGYGTKVHIEALQLLGPSKEHRHTFLTRIIK